MSEDRVDRDLVIESLHEDVKRLRSENKRLREQLQRANELAYLQFFATRERGDDA